MVLLVMPPPVPVPEVEASMWMLWCEGSGVAEAVELDLGEEAGERRWNLSAAEDRLRMSLVDEPMTVRLMVELVMPADRGATERFLSLTLREGAKSATSERARKEEERTHMLMFRSLPSMAALSAGCRVAGSIV